MPAASPTAFNEAGFLLKTTDWGLIPMTCELIKYDRPHCVTLQKTEGLRLIKGFITTWRFMHIEENRTAVVVLYKYELEKGYGWLRPFTDLYFRWDMKKRLRALQQDLCLREHGFQGNYAH